MPSVFEPGPEIASVRWETVRLYGDSEPGDLEQGMRRALADRGGRWEVIIGRYAKAWVVRLENMSPKPGAAAAVRVRVAVPFPVASAATVETAVTEALERLC